MSRSSSLIQKLDEMMSPKIKKGLKYGAAALGAAGAAYIAHRHGDAITNHLSGVNKPSVDYTRVPEPLTSHGSTSTHGITDPQRHIHYRASLEGQHTSAGRHIRDAERAQQSHSDLYKSLKDSANRAAEKGNFKDALKIQKSIESPGEHHDKDQAFQKTIDSYKEIKNKMAGEIQDRKYPR